MLLSCFCWNLILQTIEKCRKIFLGLVYQEIQSSNNKQKISHIFSCSSIFPLRHPQRRKFRDRHEEIDILSNYAIFLRIIELMNDGWATRCEWISCDSFVFYCCTTILTMCVYIDQPSNQPTEPLREDVSC